MSDAGTHHAVVAVWLAAGPNDTADAVLDRLQRGAELIDTTAGLTLSQVTLHAVFERVLAHARVRFPELAELEVTPEGLSTQRLRRSGKLPSPARTRACAQFVLSELLTVIGNLTAEILSPRLHAALQRPRGPAARRAAPSKEGKKK